MGQDFVEQQSHLADVQHKVSQSAKSLLTVTKPKAPYKPNIKRQQGKQGHQSNPVVPRVAQSMAPQPTHSKPKQPQQPFRAQGPNSGATQGQNKHTGNKPNKSNYKGKNPKGGKKGKDGS